MAGLDDVFQLSGNVLTLTPASASGPVLGDQLARTTNGAPITVRNATRVVAGDTVTVSGQADFMNVSNAAVTVTGRMGADGSVALIARFTLIEGAPAVPPWKFSRSFPNLRRSRAASRSPTKRPDRLPTRSIPSCCPTRPSSSARPITRPIPSRERRSSRA